jgi:hypothetical protein
VRGLVCTEGSQSLLDRSPCPTTHSRDLKNPSFDGGEFSFARRQRRFAADMQIPIARSMQPQPVLRPGLLDHPVRNR